MNITEYMTDIMTECMTEHHQMHEQHLIKLCTVEIVSFCCIHPVSYTVDATNNFAKLEYLSPYLHNSSS